MSRVPLPVPFPYPAEESQKLLMQAVLLQGDASLEAFEAWRSGIDFEDLPYKEFRWLAELGRIIDKLDPDWEHAPRVRAMQKYCWSHGIHILSTAKPVLTEFAKNNIQMIALKGGGQIAGNPVAMHYRTINDLDLMVPTDQIPLAADLLIKTGWRPVAGRLPGQYRAQAFDKQNNSRAEGPHKVEIDLHHRVVHFGRYGDFDLAMFDRAKAGNLLGTPVLVPSAVDQALIAISQALTPGPGDTNVWIGDVVRAVNDPDFDPDLFLREILARKIVPHAASVLTWTADTFQTPRSLIPEDRSSFIRPILLRELKTIGAERKERNLIDTASMGAAELVRSGAVTRRVVFRTDFGIRMGRLRNPPPNIRLTRGPRISWEIERAGDNEFTVRLGLPRDVKRSRDFDLWCADKWIARLRVRRIRKERLTYWSARIKTEDVREERDLILREAD